MKYRLRMRLILQEATKVMQIKIRLPQTLEIRPSDLTRKSKRTEYDRVVCRTQNEVLGRTHHEGPDPGHHGEELETALHGHRCLPLHILPPGKH